MKRPQFNHAKFIRGADVPLGGLRLTISGCAMELVGREQRDLPVLRFADDPRGLVLNVTNWNALEVAFGDDSDGWIGMPIELFVVDVDFQGTVVPGVRVRVATMETDEPDGGIDQGRGGDDDIPF